MQNKSLAPIERNRSYYRVTSIGRAIPLTVWDLPLQFVALCNQSPHMPSFMQIIANYIVFRAWEKRLIIRKLKSDIWK